MKINVVAALSFGIALSSACAPYALAASNAGAYSESSRLFPGLIPVCRRWKA
jgi:hypothetical protein